MTSDQVLHRLDKATRCAGIETIELDDARLALFGPGPGTAGFVLLMIPDEMPDSVLFRMRSMTGFPQVAEAALEDMVMGWNHVDDINGWRLRRDASALVIEGESRCADIHDVSDMDLGHLVELVVGRARSMLDRLPAITDPVADLVEGTERLLEDAVPDRSKIEPQGRRRSWLRRRRRH